MSFLETIRVFWTGRPSAPLPRPIIRTHPEPGDVGVNAYLRRGTDAQWRAKNPVLADRELAFTTDPSRLKVNLSGEPKLWSELPYLTPEPEGGSMEP